MSRKPVDWHPEALREAEAAMVWYRERSLRAAESFVGELERAIEAVAEAPRRWPIFEQGC
jgi:plasmid stabilization system protein ParE